jgi:hypothetical protein
MGWRRVVKADKAGQGRKFKAGDIMRVKSNGALVRLILPENPNEKQTLFDENDYVYVEPVEAVDDWYHINELEKP